jgi:hypothetical protein
MLFQPWHVCISRLNLIHWEESIVYKLFVLYFSLLPRRLNILQAITDLFPDLRCVCLNIILASGSQHRAHSLGGLRVLIVLWIDFRASIHHLRLQYLICLNLELFLGIFQIFPSDGPQARHGGDCVVLDDLKFFHGFLKVVFCHKCGILDGLGIKFATF